MGSSSLRSIQSSLILNLIIFLAGAITHNIALTDFSYENVLNKFIDSSLLASMQSYFALSNSSTVITGMLVVFAYAGFYSFSKLLASRIRKRSYLLNIAKI